MIDAAIAAGDKGEVETLLRYARQAHPDAGAQIDEIARDFSNQLAQRAARDAQKQRAAQPGGILDRWKGQVELGASRSTGNSRSLGLFGSLDVTREEGDWRHKLAGRIDFQSTNDVTSTERASVSYQPNFKFSKQLYVFGLAQYESDHFASYQERHTFGTGFGYGLLAGDPASLDLEGGPTLRHTEPRDGDAVSRLVGRASLRFKWKITPTLHLGQDATMYLESGKNNATALTALDTKLIGSLRARLSYQARYESDPVARAKKLDTQSRATLVYSF